MDWTTSRLQDLIAELSTRQGDANDVEVKSAAGGFPTLGPTICAFANMPEGGTIILGLDESAGFAPVGLTDVAGLEQAVAAQARQSVSPPARCEFRTFQVGGKPVLIASIDALPLHQRPARHGGQAYLRQSDGDYVMSEQEVAQLELLKTQSVRPTQPDRRPIPETSVADLDPGLLSSYLAAARRSSRRYASVGDEEVLRNTGVVARSGELTLAGLYALGSFPQSASPNLSVTAAVQLPAGSGARTRDLAHFVGPIPDLLEDAMAWVVRNTRTTMGYDARGHGVDETELPMQAVREILANALVHRNLDAITDSKRVEIRLLHDRLVISSPGGLWGVSESQLGRPGAKSAVNPVLYDLCKYARMSDGSRVIEGEGGGIREAIEALRASGLRPPQFVDTGLQFTAIMSRHTLISDADLSWLSEVAGAHELASEQRHILVSMRHGEAWTNGRVREAFAPLDSVTARRMLQQLVDTGMVVVEGVKRNASYVITPRLRLPASPAPLVEESLPAQPTLPGSVSIQIGRGLHGSGGRSGDNDRSTKHGASILQVMEEPCALDDIIAATGLTVGQVRYALGRLIDAGEVVMLGAQGVRTTRYARVHA